MGGGDGNGDELAGKRTELDLNAAAAAAIEAVKQHRLRETLTPLEKVPYPSGALGPVPQPACGIPVMELDGADASGTVISGRPVDSGPIKRRRPGAQVAFAPTAIVAELTVDTGGESERESEDDELDELPAGTVLAGRYHITELVGEGGMGAVYAAHDDDLEEEIALKVLKPSLARDIDFKRRLRVEVRLARRVSHPNVCRVHDLGVSDDLVFVTMELVRGKTLRQQLASMRAGRTPPFDLAQIVDVIVQIGSALSAAHRAGVIHRDVKPDNVILTDGRAVLTDFGVASMAIEHVPSALAGTPAYLAPEVLRHKPFDHRVDIYAVACTAYELIAGAPPFQARTLEVATRLANEPPPYPGLPAAFATPAVRSALDRVLARAISSDPALRTPTMDRFTDAFAHAARGAPLTAALTGPASDISVSGGMPTPLPQGARRAELRVATALVWYTDRPMHDIEELERIVVDAGGMPTRVVAGEISALFGAARSNGDDADRAAHAALELVATFGGRAALDTTRVLFRPGAEVAGTAGLDAVAVAAALGGEAAPGEILTSPATARQLAARFDIAATPRGMRCVLGVRPVAAVHAIESFRALELSMIEGHLERAFRERTPVIVEVRGAAGCGKTRLRKALVASIATRREVEWLIGAATPGSERAPLALIRNCSKDWHHAITANGSVESAQFTLEGGRWLEARANSHPVIVIVEDIQWGDPTSLALLDTLLASLANVPVAIITFGRPDSRKHAGAEVVTLGPLDDEHATRLARSIAPQASDRAIAEVVSRAGGSLFFVEELAEVLGNGNADAGLPASIEAVIQARLDDLPDQANQVVLVAAVIGHTIWRRALARLVPHLGEAELDAALAELERAHIIGATTGTGAEDECYQFTQALVHDVAYARLPPRERRQHHGTIAGWLEEQTRHGGSSTERVLAIAHHRERSGDAMRASVAYRQAGRRCLEVFAYGEAAAALRKASALSSAPDPELDEDLADALAETEGHAAAELVYQRAFDEVDDEDVRARAGLWYKLGHCASKRGVPNSAIARYRAGLALAIPGGQLAPWAKADPRTAARLSGGLGWALGYQLGRVDEGQTHCEAAVALLEQTPHRRELAYALSRLGGAYRRACRFGDQLGCNQRNLEIGVELDDLNMQVTALINLGVVHGALGNLDRAIAATETARQLTGRMAAASTDGLAASNLAGLYIEAGRLDEADRLLDVASQGLEQTSTRYAICESLIFRSRIAAARDDLIAARHHAEQARALARASNNHLEAVIALRLLAQLDSRQGDHAGARVRIEEALAGARTSDPFETIRTNAARARILARSGDPAAPEAFARARADLERLGATRELAVLEQLDEVR